MRALIILANEFSIMREIAEWILIILVAISIIYLRYMFVYITKNLLPSYFGEKGKNLATSEDIEALTEKVESVKVRFTEQTELLKSELQFTKSVHGGLVTEEINAIVNYVELIFSWVNTSINFEFNQINISNNKAIEEHIRYLRSFFFQSLNSDSKLRLFCNNDELLEEAFDIRTMIIQKLAQAPINCLRIVQNMNDKNEETLTYEPIASLADDLHEKKMDFVKKSFNNVVPDYNNVVKACADFRLRCRNHLYHLLNFQG